MEEALQKTIYVKKDEEILDIVNKISDVNDRSIVIMVPKDAVILQDVINLKILQRKAEELGKDILISKVESDSSELLVGDKKNITEKKNTRTPSMQRKRLSVKPKSGMSGMVKKGGVIDLRNIKNFEDVPVYEKPKDFFPSKDEESKDASSKYSSVDFNEKSVEDFENKIEEKRSKVNSEKSSSFWSDDRKNKYEEREDVFMDNSQKNTKEGRRKKEKIKKRNRKTILPVLSSRFFTVFILICIFTCSAVLYFILPKADIAIVLQAENVSGSFNVVLDSQTSYVDTNNSIVPVSSITLSSEKSENYSATGRKTVSEKATGQITIYNECSTGSQTLVADTRFLSKDGKIFRIEEGVTIPGFTKPDDSVIPGEKVVTVVAEEAGDSYNIAATTFTIPKLQELVSWKYSCLYARSDDQMSGGMQQEVTYLSQSDYDNAKEELIKSVQEENSRKIIAKQSQEGVIVFDVSEDSEEIATKSSLNVGEIAEEFSLTVTVSEDMTICQESDFLSVVEANILKLADSGDASAVSDSLIYEIKNIKEEGGETYANISASEDFVFSLDEDEIKTNISGKNESELNDYFGKINGIKSANINLWPFWVKSVPNSYDKINVTIDINDSM